MIIIDTSVALKWMLTIEENYVENARRLLQNHISQKENISVPNLIYYEAANALTTKTSLPVSKSIQLLKRIYSFNLNIINPNQAEVIKSSKLAKKYNTSVYDMLYAVIAKENKATLVTADEKFIQKTGFKFVKHISNYH